MKRGQRANLEIGLLCFSTSSIPLCEILHYFRRSYGDAVLNGAVHAFKCGYKFFGPEHIVMATDYPFGPQQGEQWIKETLDQIDGLNLPPKEKEMILGGNLMRLIERR